MIALVVLGVLVVLAVVSLVVVRRHGESKQVAPGWHATDEVFNDPSTNRLMRVWLDAQGDRHYVPEGQRKTSL